VLIIHLGQKKETILRGLSPRANYTDRATAACRRDGSLRPYYQISRPVWDPWPDFYCQIVAGLLMWAPFLTSGQAYYLQLLLGNASAVFLGRVLQDSWPYFTLSNLRLSQPERTGVRMLTPRIMVAQFYFEALSFSHSIHSLYPSCFPVHQISIYNLEPRRNHGLLFSSCTHDRLPSNGRCTVACSLPSTRCIYHSIDTQI
jgi:hypothetical protein